MLVLSRKTGERVWIGDEIVVTVVRVSGGGVRLGIEAPHELPVVREELKAALDKPDHDPPQPVTPKPPDAESSTSGSQR